MGWANYWVFVNVFPRHTKPLPHSYQLPSSTPKDLRFFQSFAWSLRQQAFFLGAEGYKLQVSTKMRASFIKTRDLNVFTMSIVTAPWVWFLVCVIFGEGFMFQISFSSKTISKMNNMNTPIPSSVSQLSSDSCSFNFRPDWASLLQQIFPTDLLDESTRPSWMSVFPQDCRTGLFQIIQTIGTLDGNEKQRVPTSTVGWRTTHQGWWWMVGQYSSYIWWICY